MTNIYGPPNEKGIQKCIKRNIKFKRSFQTEAINISHHITAKGEISKTLSIITEGDKDYIARIKYEDLEMLIRPIEVIGYKKWRK